MHIMMVYIALYRNLSEGSGLRAAVQLARLLVDGRKALVDEGSAALWSVLEDVVVRYDRHTAANAVSGLITYYLYQ